MIRQDIIDLFRSHGRPLSLDEVALKLGIPKDKILEKLAKEPKLVNLDSVSLKEVGDLISFYGRDVLFADNLLRFA